MKDIVRILQDITASKNLVYHYGKKAALNLLDGSLEPKIVVARDNKYLSKDYFL